MISKRFLSISAILVFVFLIISKMPASQVVNRLPLPANFKFDGISGSIWGGELENVVVNGLAMGTLEWSLSPLGLLIGQVSLQLEGGDMRAASNMSVEGNLSVSLFNIEHVESSGLLVFLPANPVIAQANLPIRVNMGGRFRLRFDDLAFGPTCEAISGWGDWLNASVVLPKESVSIGSITAKIDCVDDNIRLTAENNNRLGLAFESVIQPDFSNFKATGQFKPDADLPTEIHQAGRLFGTPDAQGVTQFTL